MQLIKHMVTYGNKNNNLKANSNIASQLSATLNFLQQLLSKVSTKTYLFTEKCITHVLIKFIKDFSEYFVFTSKNNSDLNYPILNLQ